MGSGKAEILNRTPHFHPMYQNRHFALKPASNYALSFVSKKK
jgi:hypothetical protein